MRLNTRFEKGKKLGNIARLLDPNEVRARITPGTGTDVRKKRRDAGFSLIEIMAGMAIIAILALAILPQFSKYFERAAIQNLSNEVSNAALTVENDYSLTGKAKYVLGAASTPGTVLGSLAGVNKSTETTLTGTVDSTGFGYTISGTNVAVTNYCVKYTSSGASAGLKVTPKGATACP